MRTRKITRELYNKKKEVLDVNYYEDVTITIVVKCEKIQIEERTEAYCFYVSYPSIECGDSDTTSNSHRLMMLPKLTDNESDSPFPLDELLAVMCDDISDLLCNGLRATENHRDIYRFV
ncbi:hypothetical protein WICPIJ_007995 [Wickerhamomyces pijperi]|uniref:Uncharacterized protein n=1 Tax=Wickerhamomyces pijperi TaxID=599730 RepID=A0A9P8TIQ7_WICPI|nr:hypothetical protein WICPIJ_007995 [Wickerhamomyces pijperi]